MEITNKGRPLAQKSINLMSKLFEGGASAFSDLVDMGRDYDQKIYRGAYKHFWGLKTAGYVKVTKDKNNQSFFHLTPKGRLSFLKYLHLEKLKIKKWDGRWRIVVFDIPEGRKKLRGYLRHRLKYLGFFPLQESVYIFPHPVPQELEQYLKENRLRKYCRYLTVDEIDGEQGLKQKFGLK
ncbi:MAG: hypothetical protein Q8R08_00635 [bacterium]|nr:hypothetical protein [bacterium]